MSEKEGEITVVGYLTFHKIDQPTSGKFEMDSIGNSWSTSPTSIPWSWAIR